jgi:hypothetical protein
MLWRQGRFGSDRAAGSRAAGETPGGTMTLKRSKYERAKAGRLAEDWPRVADAVFEALGVTRHELAQLEQALLGRLVLPGMPGYEHARHGDDLCQYSAHPRLIAYCAVPNDVRLCLEWAQRYDWRVACRSGGIAPLATRPTTAWSSTSERSITSASIRSRSGRGWVRARGSRG